MAQKEVLAGLQSAMVLQGKYCETVQSQLAGDEEKKCGTKKGGLVGDGDAETTQWFSFHRSRMSS
jgi:hypothetical protein